MAFPATPTPGQKHTNSQGTTFQYTADGTWVIVAAVSTIPAARWMEYAVAP